MVYRLFVMLIETGFVNVLRKIFFCIWFRIPQRCAYCQILCHWCLFNIEVW